MKHCLKISEDYIKGSQPRVSDYRETFRFMGIRSVLDLCSPADLVDPLRFPQHEINALGLAKQYAYRNYPMFVGEVDIDLARAVIGVLESMEKPVYFHCVRGRDRSGFVAALLRVKVCGWPADNAVNERERMHPLDIPAYREVIRQYAKECACKKST